MKEFVLIVDDDSEIRQLLCTMLNMMGYSTSEAVNGLDALDKVYEQMPDAIILDVMMPQMDGITLCKALRQDVDMAYIPIIMLSGKAQQEDINSGIQAGANRYLAKPTPMGVLLKHLKEVMVSAKELQQSFV